MPRGPFDDSSDEETGSTEPIPTFSSKPKCLPSLIEKDDLKGEQFLFGNPTSSSDEEDTFHDSVFQHKSREFQPKKPSVHDWSYSEPALKYPDKCTSSWGNQPSKGSAAENNIPEQESYLGPDIGSRRKRADVLFDHASPRKDDEFFSRRKAFSSDDFDEEVSPFDIHTSVGKKRGGKSLFMNVNSYKVSNQKPLFSSPDPSSEDDDVSDDAGIREREIEKDENIHAGNNFGRGPLKHTRGSRPDRRNVGCNIFETSVKVMEEVFADLELNSGFSARAFDYVEDEFGKPKARSGFTQQSVDAKQQNKDIFQMYSPTSAGHASLSRPFGKSTTEAEKVTGAWPRFNPGLDKEIVDDQLDKNQKIKGDYTPSKVLLVQKEKLSDNLDSVAEKKTFPHVAVKKPGAIEKVGELKIESTAKRGRTCHQGHIVPSGQHHCKERCDKLNNCKKHKCARPCEPGHYSHDCPELVMKELRCGHKKELTCGCLVEGENITCDVKCMVKFRCGHEGQGRCGAAGKIVCGMMLQHKFDCGHTRKYICKGETLTCIDECQKKLACTHPCTNLCGEPCLAPEQCVTCVAIHQAEEQVAKEAHALKVKEHIRAAKQEAETLKNQRVQFRVVELDRSSPRFLDVQDKVLKYIQPVHSWYPEVTKIEEVFNVKLLRDFNDCKVQLNDPSRMSQKFHGTDTAACQQIIKNGFKLPQQNGVQRMFGCGIYFATDSSKSAQAKYTKNSNALLLCDVLLGKEMVATNPIYNMNLQTLRAQGFDSIFVPRSTQDRGGVMFDEFVIYDPRQAYPRYIIYYKVVAMNANLHGIQAGTYMKYDLLPQRNFSIDDPLYYHYCVAESHFLKTCKDRTVTKVSYVINPVLEKQFNLKLQEFQQKYGANSEEAKPILAFHGTPNEANIDSIVKNNFQKSFIKRTACGYGHYFSEFANVSLGYAGNIKAMILCHILTGKSEDNSTGGNIGPGFDSKRVSKDADGRGQMIIIVDERQILPRYVIYFN